MNEQEFLDFWRSITWPEPVPIYYRLYYNDSGTPLFYSQQDLPGKYIDITPEQYAQHNMSVRVIDGVLKPRPPQAPPKLVPGEPGTPCDPNDVSVVVGEHQAHQKWKLRIHEQN